MKTFIAFALLLTLAHSQQIGSSVPLETFLSSQQNDLIDAFNSTNFATLSTADIRYDWTLSHVTASNIKISYGAAYDKSKQTIVADPDKNSLLYSGGSSVFNFTFEFFYSYSSLSGKGVGQIFASDIQLEKQFTVSKGKLLNKASSLKYTLDKVTFTIDPQNADASDGLTKAFATDTTIAQLVNDVSAKVSAFLQSVYDGQFDKESSVLSINFNTTKVDFDVSLSIFNIQSQDVIKITNFGVVGNTFDRTILLPSDIDITRRGVHQVLYARSIFNETFTYALNNQLWNTALNDDWDIQNFQFYAGDLNFAIPSLSNDFYLDEKIIGLCEAIDIYNPRFQWLIGTNGNLTFNLSYECYIRIVSTGELIIDFNLTTNFGLQPVVENALLQLKVLSATILGDYVTYRTNPKYVLTRPDIALYYTSSGLASLNGKKLSINLATSSFKNPGFEMTDRFVVFSEKTNKAQN